MAETREVVKMYSDYKSPYAYLAFDPVFELEQRFAIRVRWLPFQLRIKGKGQRSVYSSKVKYSYLDARRHAKPRGLWLRGPLKIYDTTPALIGGLFAERHGKLIDYSRIVFEKFFKRELEIDLADAIAPVLAGLGLSEAEYRDYLETEGPKAYESAHDEATDDQIFGVPICVFRGEPFWGYDRIPMLTERLSEAGLGHGTEAE